jgi:hypothetical protein
MSTTCYLIKKQGEYYSTDKRELNVQVENYGAEFIGTFKQPDQAEIKRRYPRLVKLCCQSGYNAEFEVVYLLWAYLWFRNLRRLEGRSDLLFWQQLFVRRHELKRIFG